MSYIKGLKCRECRREYSIRPVHVCEFCFGPLEVVYDYEEIKRSLNRTKIEGRPKTMWRYRELLPLDSDPAVGRNVGFTPLIKAERLAEVLGVKDLYLKNDAVNHPPPSRLRIGSSPLRFQKPKSLDSRLSPVHQRETLPTR